MLVLIHQENTENNNHQNGGMILLSFNFKENYVIWIYYFIISIERKYIKENLHPKLVVSINEHNCIILLKIRTRIGRSDACQPQLVVAHTQLSTICNHNHQNQQAINS